jgi:Uma2 family endonuclease
MAAPHLLRRFTVDDYHRMAAAGILGQEDRVELLDGHIVEMTPIGPAHAGCVKELVRLLYQAAGGTILLGVQDTLVLGKDSAPQPDITVLRPRPDGYRASHPRATDALLVVEVADTSAHSDRLLKVPLYARAGIPEVWLVDLPADRIEVYRHPRGDRYSDVSFAHRGETLQPMELPGVSLPAGQILG